MVFETLVADLLNRFLGDFVDNLDASQLNIGIWGGDVKLNNLEIKETALDDLDLPIKLKFGILDKLILKIPWKNIFTEPVLANLDGLYLIAVPNKGIIYNEAKADKRNQEKKQKELQRLEKNRKNQRKPKNQNDDTFTEKMIAQVIKNLQVTIKNIHIRFEDRYTNRHRPFVAGVTLESLNFQTTDENWKAAILQDSVKIFHKLISMQNLAVYWNSDTKFISDLTDKQEIHRVLQATIATDNNKPKDYKYLLQPITMEAKLSLNQNPEYDGSNWSIPKINLYVRVNELALTIGKSQYQDIFLCLDAQERFNIAQRYLKYRPNLIEYRGHYREWWHFAYFCILEEFVLRKKRNWSWERMKAHRKLVRAYQDAWILFQTEKDPGNDVKDIIQKVERELDVFNLNIARQQGEMKIDRQNLTRLEDQPKQGWTQWAMSWFTGALPLEPKKNPGLEIEGDIIERLQQEMTAEEKQKLYDAIDYHENAAMPNYPKEFIEQIIHIHLSSLAVIMEEAFELQCNILSLNVEKRPKTVHTFHAFLSLLIIENRYETSYQLPRQKIMTQLTEFIANLSYNDLVILYNLYHGISFGETVNFEHVFFTAEQLCFSFLDEFHGASIPMLRIHFTTVQIESDATDKLSSNFFVSSEYFNQVHYEWKRFLDPWKVLNFSVVFKNDCLRFWLKSDSVLPLEFIITQSLVKQLKSAYSKWPVQKEEIIQEMQAPHRFNIDAEIKIPAGIGFSVRNKSTREELVYCRFQGVQMNFCRIDKIHIFSGHVNIIQIDNRLPTASKWQFLYCHVDALNGDEDEHPNPPLSAINSDPSFSYFPAMKIEISFTPTENFDAFDCFRIKLCDMSIYLDEILLWKLIQFYQETNTPRSKTLALQKNEFESDEDDTESESSDSDDEELIRRCFFGTLDLEFGKIDLTVVAQTRLPKDLEALKNYFNIRPVSFENIIISLTKFHLFRRYFGSFDSFLEFLTRFYMLDLQKQTSNIVFTMICSFFKKHVADFLKSIVLKMFE